MFSIEGRNTSIRNDGSVISAYTALQPEILGGFIPVPPPPRQDIPKDLDPVYTPALFQSGSFYLFASPDSVSLHLRPQVTGFAALPPKA